ncbi:siderophore-interacting protein [Arthrobacter burdickii]|uniref:Siderophore-interacting protein n=1 Tax=Arthrobacter burdickii TaxID=3035920 RepID=A0ABT8K5C1_9MICC|nr:siderophore-interacting protein [Arthrobacter burdickii]MDN4612655.1 siderophore-interacting protein [Arthrobacter burdickii]
MSSPVSASIRKPPRPQAVLTVEETQWLSPHLVRVVAGGPGFSDLQECDATDMYAKLLFAKPELGLVPPYDLAALQDELPADDRPVKRTYTIRSLDREARRLAIDFVVHGDEGIAGPWAAQASPGDALVLMGPSGKWSPDQDADWHLFVGDDSALPAIAAGIEALHPAAVGHAYLEVDSAAEVLPLDAPAGLELHWLYRDGQAAGTTTLLADAVAAGPWPEGRVDAFVHGERGAMKALRDVLFKEKNLARSQVSLSGYWAYGREEDTFQAEKREPIGKILDD